MCIRDSQGAVDAQLPDDAAQRHRNHDGLEQQGDAGGHVQVMGFLDVGLPADRQRQHQGMQGEGVEQRIDPILIQQQEAHHHHAAGQKMRDIEFQTVHHRLRDTNSNSAPSKPNISAAPKN